MKRIIDGKTYNTETATLLAEVPMHTEDDALFDDLYQTRHGAFFRQFGNLSLRDNHPDYMRLEPLDPNDAQNWLERHDFVDVLEKIFGNQPEAGETESHITVRIPDNLKARIEKLAIINKQSLNAWIMRCFETCANDQLHDR